MNIGNQLKTGALLGALSTLLLIVGQLTGGAQGLTIALLFALIMNVGSYLYSDRLVLKMYKAKEVDKSHKLYKTVDKLRRKAHLPMPKVYIIPGATPNAFATGRNPNNSAVAATESIIQILSQEELEGVMAHELTHVKNRDTLIATIAATIASIIAYTAMMARWAAIFGGFGGDDRNGGNGLELIVLAILTPIIATIIQLAISRSREYLADDGAAKISENPKALARALRKISEGVSKRPMKSTENTKTTASLFIINPLKGSGLTNLFSTHPPVDKRIERLENR
ncbi:MAG: zinc metalloprotease HtpX [Candidatus Woesearchaeota archaeon]